MTENNDKSIQIEKNYRHNLDIMTEKVVELLLKKGLHISTAESCTGGLLSELITSVSGASEVFEFGVCTYSEKTKNQVLSVPYDIIDKFGVVSGETALAMVKGLEKLSGADICVSVTGIAGPSGGTPEKPVGTVYTAFSYGNREFSKLLKLYGDDDINREIIRLHTALCVFETVEQLLMEEVQ